MIFISAVKAFGLGGIAPIYFILFSLIVIADAPLPYNYNTIIPSEGRFDAQESFRTDLFTGAATYEYEFKLPPGTNDLAPVLSLEYNHHVRKEAPGIVGSGWSLTESYIQRDVNFTRDEDTDDEFILVLNGISHRLVDQKGNRYRTKVDSFLYVEFVPEGGLGENETYWRVKTKDGTDYRFGFNNESEYVGTENNLVWRWNLDKVQDTYGNSINYTYKKDVFGDSGTTYLDSISYNNDQQRVIDFIYEDSNRPDIWEVYPDGNKVKTLRRLKEIAISAEGSLVRRYAFGYNYTKEMPGHSFLQDITEFGTNNDTALPATYFEYYPWRDTWTQEDLLKTPECDSSNTEGCFVDDSGNDFGVRLMDVDRDGFVDFIRADDPSGGSPTSKAWGNARTSWKENIHTYPSCESGDSSLCFTQDNKDNGVRFGDVNGDGLVDILEQRATSDPSHTSRIYINDGDSWDHDATYSYPGCSANNDERLCFVKDNVNRGVRLADVNGDGFIDILESRETGSGAGESRQTSVWINKGLRAKGWEDKSNEYSFPSCDGSTDKLCFVKEENGNEGLDNGVRLVDINNDGLIDIIMARDPQSGSPEEEIWLGTGSGWTQLTISYPDCQSGSTGFCFVIMENDASKDNGVRMADLNGDGLVDLARAVISGGDGSSEIQYNDGNGWVGVEIKIPQCDGDGVKAEGCFVKSTGEDYGTRLGDVSGDGVADTVRAYKSGSAGLTRVYINEASKTGLLKTITSSIGGNTTIDYKASTAFNNTGTDSLSDIGFSVWVVDSITEHNGLNNEHLVNQTTLFNYSGGMYDYGDRDFRGFANVTEFNSEIARINHLFHQNDGRKGREFEREIINHTDGALFLKESFEWEATTTNDTHKVVLIKENSSLFEGSAASPKVTEVTYKYDDYGNIIQKTSEGDLDSSGDERYEYFDFVYNTTVWIVATAKKYTLYEDSTDNSTKVRESKYSYDGLSFGVIPLRGSVTEEEEVLNTGSNPVTTFGYDTYGNLDKTTDANGHISEQIYGLRDTTFTFIDQEINARGNITNNWFDLGTGNLLSTVDANGFNTSFTYDQFGRIDKEIRPLDSETYPTKNFTYLSDGVAPEIIRVQQREQSGTTNTFDTYNVQDGLGNTIQTKSEGENDKQIVEDTYYDNLSRVRTISNKYLTDTTVGYTSPSSSVDKTHIRYDVLDRTLQIDNPDGTERTFTYNHWTETQFDENSNYKVFTRDAYGQISTVIEANEGENYTTTYDYTIAEELTNITDNEGNKFTFVYDTLGRRALMVDPDLGTWEYMYDGVDNLIQTNDFRSIITSFTYDELDRITKKSTANEAFNYVYDSPTAGTLSSVFSANFARNYTYDDRLRVIQESKNISGTVYTLTFNYDALDRSNNTAVNHVGSINLTYSTQGLVDSIEGITTSTTHNEIGTVLERTYANSEVTEHTYDQRNFRLKSIKTGSKQELHYDYNAIADILGINDIANNRVYNMSYDALSRLTSAKRNETSSEATFDFSYTYSSIGNLLNISSTTENLTYFYNGSSAHAPYRIIHQLPVKPVNISNFADLTGSGNERVFGVETQNTGLNNTTHINWTLETGTENVTSTIGINLTTGETTFSFIEYNYGSSGTFEVKSIVEGGGKNDTASISVTIP